MYFVQTPNWVQQLLPNYLWRIPTTEQLLYLTFDDGPIPFVTPWVVETLAAYQAKGTFFCVGDNARKHSSILKTIVAQGHSIGNHTYHHLDGWKTSKDTYLQDIAKCAEYVNSKLFRPPYGHIRPAQASAIRQDYQIVLWDVLSGDFDTKLSKEDCLQNILSTAQAGSIIVLHDSLKAEERLRYVLPRLLAHFSHLGYRFEAL